MTHCEADLEQQIETLEGLDLHGFRVIWTGRYGAAPKLRSAELLGLMLAWRMQADMLGGLASQTRRSLKRSPNKKLRPPAARGTRLVREWRGMRHQVMTLGPDAYLYQGETYASLSQIARLITGARWNGPRFFGLREQGASR